MLPPAGGGKSYRFEIHQEHSILNKTCPKENFYQSLTYWSYSRTYLTQEKGNNPTPAPSSHPVPPKGVKTTEAFMKLTSQEHGLTKKLRPNYRTI